MRAINDIMVPIFADCTERDIEKCEEEISGTLPTDYKEFLLRTNGVLLDCQGKDAVVTMAFELDEHPERLPSWEDVHPEMLLDELNGELIELPILYGLKSVELSEAIRPQPITFYGEYYRWTPDRLLLIGEAGNNGYERLCLSTGPPDFGCVYLWVPPGMPLDDAEHPTMEFCLWLANSFDEFWSSLRVMSEPERMEWGMYL